MDNGTEGKYQLGQEVGGYVLRSSCVYTAANRSRRYHVTHLQCGTKQNVHEPTLTRAAAGELLCPVCNPTAKHVRPPRKNCRVCSDCPALLPFDGSVCACGERRKTGTK